MPKARVDPAPARETTALTRPDNPDTLRTWVRLHIGVDLTRTPLIPGHSAPFDYLVHTYFEGACSALAPSTPAHALALPQVAAHPRAGEKPAENCASLDATSTYDKTQVHFSPQESPLSQDLSKSLAVSPSLSTSLDQSSPSPTQSSVPSPQSCSCSPSPTLPLSHSSPSLPLDSLVWANRGGGKTFLAALATLLDLLFKPGIHVTILGGSLEQSQRMHEHLRKFFEHPDLALELAAPITDRRVLLKNKSRATVLAQSQASVRGTRVQKLRCDEVDLFDPQIWSAVQLTTRSLRVPETDPPAPWGTLVKGSIDALSTMHQPHGLMWHIVTSATSPTSHPQSPSLPVPQSSSPLSEISNLKSHPPVSPSPTLPLSHSSPRTLFRWGLLDTLQHCPPERSCTECPLHPDCQGRAKTRKLPAGHITIDDAIRMQSRVSDTAWKSEMLCLTPRRTDAVYPEFDRNIHVGDWPMDMWRSSATEVRAETLQLGYSSFIAGIDFGYRSPTVILMAWLNSDNVLHIEAENVEAERTLDHHINILLSGAFHTPLSSRPAPLPLRVRASSSPFSPLPSPLFSYDPSDLPRPAWVGADPAGDQCNHHTGISSNQALRKAGLKVRNRRLELLQGIELVRARLKPAAPNSPSPHPPVSHSPTLPLSHSSPPPRLLVHRRCTHLIDALERYHFPENNPHSLEPVKDGHDHAADALRYLILNLDKPYAPMRVIRYW